MKIVAFVPIRFESQRLPGKNLLPVGGRPMCWHIFKTLLKSEFVDKTYVYCSKEGIKKYIPEEVEFLRRPEWLDGHEVKGMEIYQEFIKVVKADIYVLAHATSPFLKTCSVDNSLKKVTNGDYDSAFSVKKVQTFAWYKGMPINYELDDIPRTQTMEPVFIETSGFYIFRKEIIEERRRIGQKPWMEIVSGIEAG